ncbi:MAG: hypothetical protein PHU14_04230 [Methylovulum sp.]|nr:hypothetical protein [Methylovulum sp.]
MKQRLLSLIAVLLTACAPEPTKKVSNIPPLTSVAGKIMPGMGVPEVNKTLSGHQPAHQYTDQGHAIWEITERNGNPQNNSLVADSLTVVFDQQGLVKDSSATSCFLPDVEPPLGNTPATRCYQQRLFPFTKQQTYDAIKRLLVISNYQIDHSDAASEIISATGLHEAEGNKNKMMFIKLSIIFSAQGDFTHVVMSATFSLSEKQSTWVQAGLAGVSIPVPLPFQKTEEWIDSGIVTPRFYLNFYDALAKLIASEYLRYQPLSVAASPIPRPYFGAPPAVSFQPPEPNTPRLGVTPPANTSNLPIDSAQSQSLDDNLPIDSTQPRKHREEISLDNPVEPSSQDSLAELGDKPIDSDGDSGKKRKRPKKRW